MVSVRTRNIPAGTLVDTVITNPDDFDYFFNSHEGIQGTSRPSHYTVIKDDHGFSADDLYQLTFFLCHTYVKCTRSLSIPAPVKYADLAAYRARDYIQARNFGDLDVSSASSDDEAHRVRRRMVVDERIEQMNAAIRVAEHLRGQFYFC